MAANKVTSDLFVGRTDELNQFENILAPKSDIRVFCIHTEGEGGIGKTQLLLRMQNRCRSLANKLLFANELIDFYEAETRTKLGVMRQIAANLGVSSFPRFNQKIAEYEDVEKIGIRQKIFEEIQSEFENDYRALSTKVGRDGKLIVLFFDSYEYVQTEISGAPGKRAEATEFSKWLESTIFSRNDANTRIVVAGRYMPSSLGPSEKSIKQLRLQPLSLDEARNFWRQCFGENELLEIFDSDDEIEVCYQLANGQPIFLALFADWINLGESNTRELLAIIEKDAGAKVALPVTKKQREIFEKEIISQIGQKMEPPESILTYLAIAYRRMTPEMLQYVTQHEPGKCQAVVKKLQTLSFIKSKRDDVILLHDEMRRLISQHFWGVEGVPRYFREKIARRLVEYYEMKLLSRRDISVADREAYHAELLGYAFFADPVKTAQRQFPDMVEIATRNGKYDYAELLLREAEYYDKENPGAIPFPYFIEIHNQRIHYLVEVKHEYQEAQRLVEEISKKYQDHADWQDSFEHGRLLMEKGNIEYWRENFASALDLYQRAKEIFHINGQEDWVYEWVYRTLNLIGYALYRQARFDEAESYFIQSSGGFYGILDLPDYKKEKGIEMLKGLQYPLGNLAMVCRYTGRFDLAVRYADLQLAIVQALPENRREVARTKATLSHVLAFRGHTVDALRLANESEELLATIQDRVLAGRVKMNLAWATHRTDELLNLLEYYRAEELTDLIVNKNYIDQPRLRTAKEYLLSAIATLGEEPPIYKELADAYFILGEMYLAFSPLEVPDKFDKAEEALQKALEHGKTSGFSYRVIDTLESLVLLYYFWGGHETSAASRSAIAKKRETYLQEFESHADKNRYPNLLARLKVTLGDLKFDEALQLFRSRQSAKFDHALSLMKAAFQEYVDSAHLKKGFNEDRYYMMLRVIYNRLSTLIEAALGPKTEPEHRIPVEVYSKLGDLAPIFQKSAEAGELMQIYNYIHLLVSPEYKADQIKELEKEIQRYREGGKLRWAVILNDLFIKICRFITLSAPENDEARERLVLSLNSQVSTYRILGDEYHARRFVQIARDELAPAKDPTLRMALEGRTDASAGELAYRRGEYARPFEFYLRGELKLGRERFDTQYSEGREQALKLLKQGQHKLSAAIEAWKDELAKNGTRHDRNKLLMERIKTYRQKLAETYFRLAELLMINEQFDDEENGEKGAFSYFDAAINESQTSEYEYRHDDAIQSYVVADYFAPKKNPALDQERRNKSLQYEQEMEEKIARMNSDAGSKYKYVWLLGRLRITQADKIFGRYFGSGQAESNGANAEVLQSDRAKTKALRKMLSYYVEACNFKAQYHQRNYEQCLEVLLRRIDLISDQDAISILRKGLPEIWNAQKYLKEKTHDLETVMNFLKIRSVIVEYEKPNRT
jgi:hypothetical protein